MLAACAPSADNKPREPHSTEIGNMMSGRVTLNLIPWMALLAAPWTLLYAASVPGLNIEVHTFHPKAAPTGVAQQGARVESSTEAGPVGARNLGPTAIEQINALDLEKESRAAAQDKIDSRLLQTIRMLQGRPVAEGVPTLETDVELDDSNRLYVDISAKVSADLQDRLVAAGASIVHSNTPGHNIRALVPFEKMDDIAAWDDIYFISPRRKVVTHGAGNGVGPAALPFPKVGGALNQVLASCASQGSVVSQGDKAHKADLARSTFGICGDGVKIGVLSDGVDGLADSQASGDLAAVTVLPGQEGSGSEGTAMLELIHDLAPNAQLFFASGFDENFAQNIRDLRQEGCDIIVDDLTAYAESPFQDGQAPSVISNTNGGAITQAVNDVVADGALYFSSAGNEGNLDSGTSGTWQGDFSDGGPAANLVGGTGRVHLFAPGVITNRVVDAGSAVNLYWADPLGGSSNDYDLYVLDKTGTSVVGSSTNVQNGSQDPFESVGESSVEPGNLIVIVKQSGNARFLYVGNYDGVLQYATSGQILGHNGSRKSISIAATPAAEADIYRPGSPTGPFPNAFNAGNSVELFTSDGPRHIFFEADGTPITPGNFSSTGGQVLQKPDFTAADGNAVTGSGGFETPFFGTSAAAPHSAALAALVKSANPGISNAGVIAALKASAIDIMAPGWDRNSGHGIIMAYEAVVAAGSAVCGSDNGQTLAIKPTNLCSVGTPSVVSGSGPWSWSCTGLNGVAQCSAARYDGDVGCQPGPLMLGPVTLNGTQIYQSETVLSTTGAVSVSTKADITFVAKNSIRLTSGFRVATGARFTARLAAVACLGTAQSALSQRYAEREQDAGGSDNPAAAPVTVIPAPRLMRADELPLALHQQFAALGLDPSDLEDLQSSADGETIVFATTSALVPDDYNDQRDVYLYHAREDQLELLSRNVDGDVGNGASDQPRIDGWGEYVVYRSAADNLTATADTNGVADIYLADLRAGNTQRISWTETGEETPTASAHPDLGGEHLLVVYERMDETGQSSIYANDQDSLLAQRQDAGDCAAQHPALSADARRLAYLCGKPGTLDCAIRVIARDSGELMTADCPSDVEDNDRLYFDETGTVLILTGERVVP